MRPSPLDPLFADVETLRGIGPRLSHQLEGFIGRRLIDLVWHMPYQIIDRSYRPSLAALEAGRIATCQVDIVKHQPARRRGLPYRITVSDATGFMDLVFFQARGDWLQKLAPEGSTRIVSGRVEQYRDTWQMVHPDHVVTPAAAAEIPQREPVYPLTAGISLQTLRKAIAQTVPRLPQLPEWQDPAWLDKQAWPHWHDAVAAAHSPTAAADIMPNAPARQRLAYDELLANQITLNLIRRNKQIIAGQSVRGDGQLRHAFLEQLPFALTAGQQSAVKDIASDLEDDKRMLRLVQGDVGSGKTFVAMMAMLQTVEARKQVALMAPTEILARQHAATLGPYCEALGVPWLLLTSRNKGKAREKALEQIATGETPVVFGTHALFQDDVEFADLALAIVDEQHRFGVKQRLQLGRKGNSSEGGTNILVMTATPIPRTLTLAAYGDMDISRITDKPAGRQPIDTRLISFDRYADLKQGLARLIARGERGYWVCPLVSESELSDLAAAEARFADLRGTYGDAIGLIHGQMKADQKDKVMQQFADGELSILVATTVIEVGVDVPEATTIIIEHAERFGLAQLHQLRGRVGRGDKPSNCILFYRGPLGEIARARLEIMRQSQDGFDIAEEDLRLRGSGEVLGTRQSGLPQFKIADLDAHASLLPAVHDDARLVLDQDPQLLGPRGQAIRQLLYLFERTEALKFLEAG
jgi:ATP-dependent DNA helicase RecG